jgi:drug/metabolite transporter (DMT)-like permease
MSSTYGFTTGTSPAQRRRVILVLCAAVLGVSSSAVLVRSMEASSLAISAWRTLGAATLLSPLFVQKLRHVERRDLGAIVLAGVFLGLHFWMWFESLSHTTVLRSTVLVCLVPLWTGLIEALVWKRVPPRRFWIGTCISLIGASLLSPFTMPGEASWYGDALALSAGVLWALYFLIGKDVRARVGTMTWMGLACAAAAGLLWPIALATQTVMWGYEPLTWWLLLAAVLGPQLVGHQGFAYAVRWLPASTIALVTLLEPVGASALALIVLDEWPPPIAIVGGAFLLVGLAAATRRKLDPDGGAS